MVMEVVHEDMGDGNMQCINHPFKNSAPGGICAICLQEKLGNLVSSSFPITVFPASSSSSSPSFRSDFDNSNSASTAGVAAGGGGSATRHLPSSSSQNGGSNNEICHYTRRSSRLPFILTQRKKKKNYINHNNNNGVLLANVSSENTSIVFKRSKSTVTPRRRGMHFLDESFDSPYKKGFWSFLYTSKLKKSEKSLKGSSFTPATPSSSTVGGPSSVSGVVGPARSRDNKKREDQADESESPDDVGLDRKVSRSRSVGCGSRSFSGDFFERISTGFGDCTLRRVESQREGKSKVQSSMQRNGGGGQDYIKDRVRCGGIFSGFMITSSSSSSSSMVSEDNNNNGKPISVSNSNNNNNSSSAVRNLSHGRSKSWGWALASPMRAFSKPSSNSAGKRAAAAKHVTTNLASIPSLLAVSS